MSTCYVIFFVSWTLTLFKLKHQQYMKYLLTVEGLLPPVPSSSGSLLRQTFQYVPVLFAQRPPGVPTGVIKSQPGTGQLCHPSSLLIQILHDALCLSASRHTSLTIFFLTWPRHANT